MICQNHILRTFLLGPILGAILLAVIVAGCAGDAGHGDGRDSDRSTASQGISGGEDENSGGEHGGGREGSGEHGSGGEGSGRESSEADMSSPNHSPWDSRGTVSSADWLFTCSTTQQPGPCTERYATRSHRNSATCRPNLTSSRERGRWGKLVQRSWDT